MKVRLSAINRFFNIVLGALAMLVVALTSAFIAMRLAIHGREVKVPNLTGLTIADAGREASRLGLNLTIENRFYSPTTPPGRILAQYPTPGITVRREWAVRATESLGPQQVSIPDVLGQSERTASINIRRLALDLGTVGNIEAPGEASIVLAQTPNPNASGVDRPRVSLLLSQPEQSAGAPFLMPSLTGLPLMSAAARASAAGLRVVSAEEQKIVSPLPTTPAAPMQTTNPTQSPIPAPATTTATTTATAITPTAITAVPGASTATVVAQSPPSGYRVVKGDPVHITITY